MDADGRSFQLLLGEADWARVTTVPGVAPLHWDPVRHVVGLTPFVDEPSVTPGEALLVPAQRRAAAADAFGNIYAIADDAMSLRVTSAGSGRSSRFWPPETPPAPSGLFVPVDRPPAAEPAYFLALTVTSGGWLVATRTEPDLRLSLLLFDLMGGGAPQVHALLPGPISPRPAAFGRDRGIALVPRPDGGMFLLDRHARRLWQFDRTLALEADTEPPPAEPDPFQPADGGTRETRPAPAFAGLDVASFAPDPMSIALWGETLMLLDRSGDVHGLVPGAAPVLLARAGGGAHDMIVGRITLRRRSSDRGARQSDPAHRPGHTTEEANATRLLVVHEDGNRARAFVLPQEPGAAATLTPELLPLRRFGGRALIMVRGFARYDSFDGFWVPIVKKPLSRYATDAGAVLPRFDCGTPGTVWDRIVIDGRIPPGAYVTIEARAFDDPAAVPAFVTQPRPLLAPGRVDLLWHADNALPKPDPALGSGSHMLLLQGARGRYLELRLRLGGDGSATPQLRALRVWRPRLSWVERYLPSIYRTEPTAFLDRFLANLEGQFRCSEERIAGAAHLFDPATAPAEWLSWLADWFDVALDPSWDEARRRLFIAHAEQFFRWRGTQRGLLMALRLAFDACVDERLFDEAAEQRPGGIRIVEAFLVRAIGSLAAGDPGNAFSAAPSGDRWTPAEGNAGLARRIAEAPEPDEDLGRGGQVPLFAEDAAVEAALRQALGFQPSGSAERTQWRAFQRAAGRAEADLLDLPQDAPADALWTGFLALPSRNRQRWQDFLEGRYRRVERLHEAHGVLWERFDQIPLPDHLPQTAAAQADWLAFETQVLPAAAAAHRFSVLLPLASVDPDPDEMHRRLQLAHRIVTLEKPAHTTFDVRFFWAMNRIGEARLGFDTALGQGSRAPELLPDAILGRAYLGAALVGPDGATATSDRRRLAC
jgi:phage tail-like protein